MCFIALVIYTFFPPLCLCLPCFHCGLVQGILLFLCLSKLTLRHLSVLCAIDPFAIVEPDDSGVRQAGNFTFEHSLLPFDHIQIVKGFDEIWHSETLHLILRDLWLLRD